MSALGIHRERMAAMATAFRPDDIVRVKTSPNTVVGSIAELLVEGFSLDHHHTAGIGGHGTACYQEDRIEYHLAVNPRPDGSADFRTREHGHNLILIRRMV